MRKYTVPLFSVQGHRLRHITIAQAEEMLSLKQAHKVSAANKPLKIQLKALDRAERQSPATISTGEMQANAFTHLNLKGSQSRTAHLNEQEKREREFSGRAAEDFIELATFKVAAWPFVGDTKAVRVAPRV